MNAEVPSLPVFYDLLWLLEVPERIIKIGLQVTIIFLQEILPHTVMLLELTCFWCI